MGKKLIIKGADFSAVAVDSLLTLDSIAWDGMTYRDIFETNNCLGINPGFENGSFSPLSIAAGSPAITNDAADSGEYSLKAFGTSSQQVKKGGSNRLISYYIGARINCIRYQAGKLGVVLGSTGATISSVTNGFETVTGIRNNENTVNQLYVGSMSSANLDGYVDTPVVVLETLFTSAPTKEQFTQLYNQYVAIKKGI